MNIPKLHIGHLTADIPIVQGGMGVRVSLASLAAAVAEEGGIGTISSIGLGDFEAAQHEYERVSREALQEEIRKARALTQGVLAVNFMGVLSNVEDLLQTAVREGIQMIVFGAGLPMRLPRIVQDRSVNLVPIVSSARGAELILRGWAKHFEKTADALILDLEDSVPPAGKVEARGICAARIGWLAEHGQRVYVRINRSPHLYDFDDLLAVVQPGLEGLVISKPVGPEDVDCVSMMLSEAEMRSRLPIGSIRVIPLLETARALQMAFELAGRARVAALAGATARNADVARALGYVWSPGGRESLYFKSRTVMAARAAGKLPIGGLWQQVHDLEGLRAEAEADRALGMSGELVLHPSNVPIVNEVYRPSAADVSYYEGMIAALEASSTISPR